MNAARHCLSALLLALAVTAVDADVRAQVIDRILAVVDQQLITLSDVRGVLRLGLVDVSGVEDQIGAALDRMIDRRLMLVEVDRYLPPEPGVAAIDARVAQVQERLGDAPRLQAVLAQAGMTPDDLRRFIRDDLRIEAYIQQRFASAVQPADRERLMREWLEGLRRRGNVTKLYRPGGLGF